MTASVFGRARVRDAGVLSLVCVAMTLAGCATASAAPDGASASAAAQAARVDPSRLTTGHPVTVLDDGDGAELCLGVVAASLPPQCRGPRLVGWAWDRWTGHYEEAMGSRFGMFLVTGAYDVGADAFTPTEVVPEGEVPPAEHPPGGENGYHSTCPPPAGGWRVPDAEKTTPETMQATFDLAATLPGYSKAWMDQSPNPASTKDLQEVESAMNDPMLTIINVAVTEDLAGAETALREVWGGMLCVSESARTEAEMHELQQLMSEIPGTLMSSSDAGVGVVDILVVFDDGTLQTELDAEHGPGVVRVESALKPAS